MLEAAAGGVGIHVYTQVLTTYPPVLLRVVLMVAEAKVNQGLAGRLVV